MWRFGDPRGPDPMPGLDINVLARGAAVRPQLARLRTEPTGGHLTWPGWGLATAGASSCSHLCPRQGEPVTRRAGLRGSQLLAVPFRIPPISTQNLTRLPEPAEPGARAGPRASQEDLRRRHNGQTSRSPQRPVPPTHTCFLAGPSAPTLPCAPGSPDTGADKQMITDGDGETGES